MKSTKKKATVEKATTKVKEAASQLADKASSAAENGKQGVVQYLEEQKEEAASKVRDLDHVLRRTAEEVSNPGLGKQLERLADEVDRLAGTLESAHYDDVIRGIESFGRRNPTMFLATTFGLGIAVSRFLRASSRRPHGSDLYLEENSYSQPMATDTYGSSSYGTETRGTSTLGTTSTLSTTDTYSTGSLGTTDTFGTSTRGTTNTVGTAGIVGTDKLGSDALETDILESDTLGTNTALGKDTLS